MFAPLFSFMSAGFRTPLWIVTGGIGTGKSQVCRLLTEASPDRWRFSSDESVTRAYADSEVRRAMREGFDLEIPASGITPEQRVRLRELIGSSAVMRERLESILHPFVFQELEELRGRASAAGAKVLVAEVPLYYETGKAVAADRVIVVAASKASQLERLRTSRGLNEEAANRMLGLQLPIDTKMALADVVVWNDGSLQALDRQVRLQAEQLPET